MKTRSKPSPRGNKAKRKAEKARSRRLEKIVKVRIILGVERKESGKVEEEDAKEDPKNEEAPTVETASVGLTEDSSAADKNAKLSSDPNECTTENNKGEADAVKETKAAEDGKESSEPPSTKTERESANEAEEKTKENEALESKNAPPAGTQEDEKNILGENKEEQKKAEDELVQENYAPFRRVKPIEPKETDDSNVLRDKENIEKQLDTNKTDIPTKEVKGEERAEAGENNSIKAEDAELQKEEKICAQEKADKRSCCIIA